MLSPRHMAVMALTDKILFPMITHLCLQEIWKKIASIHIEYIHSSGVRMPLLHLGPLHVYFVMAHLTSFLFSICNMHVNDERCPRFS